MAAVLVLCARSVRETQGSQLLGKIELRNWAFDQFVQGGAFRNENLAVQLGVNLYQSLRLIFLPIEYYGDLSPYKFLDATPLYYYEYAPQYNILIRKIADCFLDSLFPNNPPDIPVSAFLSISCFLMYSQILPISKSNIEDRNQWYSDIELYSSPAFLKRANSECKQSTMRSTLPLIAVCTLNLESLASILEAMLNAGCDLEEISHPPSARILLPDFLPIQSILIQTPEIEIKFRCAEVSPLSCLVAINDWERMLILLELSKASETVCNLHFSFSAVVFSSKPIA